MKPNNELKILIVGGGIGGLTLAALLRQRGIEPLLIEREKKFSTIGYVMAIMPNGLRILEEIGVDKTLIKEGQKILGLIFRNEQGKQKARISLTQFVDKYGPSIEIEREQLHKMLQNVNKDTNIKMETTITKLKNHKDGVDVVLSDGTKDTFDLVIGADGIGSQTRNLIHKKPAKDYAGFDMVLAWIPQIITIPKNVSYYLGDGKLFAIFPTKSTKHICVAFLVKEPPKTLLHIENTAEYLKENFNTMGGDVPKVLDYIHEADMDFYRNDDNEVHLRTWYDKRVVLLGDAAHATSLIMGEGASMAMEDAYVLVKELLGNHTIEDALHEYNERRYKRVHALAEKSGLAHFFLKAEGVAADVRDNMATLLENQFTTFYEKLFKEMP